MASLQIRDLPEHLHEALARRAKKHGRSLAQQAMRELEKMSQIQRRTRRQAVLAEIIASEAPPAEVPDPVEIVREDRNR